MLTVPEEFAGQMMKCPLCNGTFTVPGLPGSAAPPLPPPAPAPASATEHFSLLNDPLPPPSPPSTPPLSHPEPPPSTATTTTPSPSTSSLVPEDYQHGLTVWFSPKVLSWIAPVCLLLIFFLQFCNWVGLYPGGVPSVTQNAWQAAFGLYTEDGNLKTTVFEDDKYKPRPSVLTIFYLLLFFQALVLTIASVALGLLHLTKLPPALEKLLPWRWGIVAAVNLILFLFLALQLLLGFSLDNHYTDWVDKQVKTDSKEPKSTPEQLKEDSMRGKLLENDYHTIWLRLVVLLHIVAIISAPLMFWVDKRGTRHPLPKLELRW